MGSGNSNPSLNGGYVGTGSLITIASVGYRPKKVELVNLTDPAYGVHIDTMPAGSLAVITDTCAGPTSGGITLTDEGFTIGTDGNFNTAGEQVYWRTEG